MWLAVKSALHAHFAHDDTCPWCLVLKTNLATKEKQDLRTLANSRELAHLPPLDQEGNEVFPFTCKLCKVIFDSREAWEKENMRDEKLAKLFTQVHRGSHLASAQPVMRAPTVHPVLAADASFLLCFSVEMVAQTICSSKTPGSC